MKHNRLRLLVFITIFLAVHTSFSQGFDDQFKVDYETPLTIDLENEEVEFEESVFFSGKSKKKNVYHGLKTKKGFTKSYRRRHKIIEQFRFLKEFQEPPANIQDVFWFDLKNGKIMKSLKYDPKYSALLHGPYKKTVDDQIIEEAYFYKGVRHGRRMIWNTRDILQSKQKWYKGLPMEAQVAYYNKEKKQYREIIPFQNGEREGDYLLFFEDGEVALEGEFESDQKIGLWREYLKTESGKRRHKKDIQYPKEPHTGQHGFLLREWNERGERIYDYARSGKKEKRFVD